MGFIKKLSGALHARGCAYLFFILSVCAFIFLDSAKWTYGWIAALYPLGAEFVPVMLGIISVCIAVTFLYLLAAAVAGDKLKNKKGILVFNIIHTIFSVLAVVLFLYTLVLIFGLDSGFALSGFAKGIQAILPELIYLCLALGIGLVLVFCSSGKKAWQALVCSVVVSALVISVSCLGSKAGGVADNTSVMPVTLQSENAMDGAKIVFESLKNGEKADAENLLSDNNWCWTAQAPNRAPAEGFADANNCYVEIELAKPSRINTAIIEEVGNRAQYFRLQAFVHDEWITCYQSEKIQSMRLCSFDPVETDRIRLSIDKFRNDDTPVKIKSIKLYNEPVRSADDFEVTAYQRLDGDVPTEILAKGEAYVKNYARFYDVYSTVIVFAAVHWDENGNMHFGEAGEEQFAKELTALKEIIAKRSNQNHKVKLIVTTLADGAFGTGVNFYMTEHWEKIADQTVAFAQKYDIDGVDIDWEYPQTSEDWKIYDSFIQKLKTDLNAVKKGSIISTALSAGQLGLSKETYDSIDQIQFMAYDGNDTDGYQSSLQQAEDGVKAFVDNGCDLSKINIGIAAYGRPINSTPYWATWRDLKDANYWNNKYYTVEDADQVYEGTFCAPALAGDKTAYALFSGAGGVMVFRVGCDKTMDDPNSVANGIENTLNRYVTNW